LIDSSSSCSLPLRSFVRRFCLLFGLNLNYFFRCRNADFFSQGIKKLKIVVKARPDDVLVVKVFIICS
jgi:hypothetical protein